MRHLILISLALFVGGCALPQPTNVERQDFIPQQEILLSEIVKKAQEDYARGRLYDSELRLRQALLLSPGTTQIQLNLARILARNGQSGEAEELFAEVLKRKQEQIAILNFAGEAYFESLEYDLAEKYFERARVMVEKIREDKKLFKPEEGERTYRNLSTVNVRAGNLIAALCYINEAFEINPLSDNLARKARIELARGGYVNVEQLVTEFLAQYAGINDARLYLLRSMARLALDQRDKAIEDIKAANKREETIGEYALEYRLLFEVLVESQEEQDEEEEDASDEDAPIEQLKINQRLYIPPNVLKMIDDYLHQKELELEE